MFSAFLFVIAFTLTPYVMSDEIAEREDPYAVSYHKARNPLKKRQAQSIINPCPEELGLKPQYCTDRFCGGDTKMYGIW